jgi:hypothetical protein
VGLPLLEELAQDLTRFGDMAEARIGDGQTGLGSVFALFLNVTMLLRLGCARSNERFLDVTILLRFG